MGDKLLPEPLSIDDQINNLLDCKLIIEDKEEARRKLNEVSYYRLIKAYDGNLREKSGIFKRKVSFRKIWNIYEFDNQLRLLLIPQLERIEITLRCRIVNYFSVKYGSIGYLDSKNFRDSESYLKLHNSILDTIANHSDSPSISNFIKNYKNGDIPFYAIIDYFSFGLLAAFYRNMKVEDQKIIASQYYRGDNEYLSSWFESLYFLRNKCAHFGRIYAWNFRVLPKAFKKDDNEYKDNNRLFRLLCCMRYICYEYGDWGDFVESLNMLLDKYKAYIKPTAIGCSDGWSKKLLDQEKHNEFFIDM